LSAFAKVVKETDIPKEHYHAFMEAMLLDVHPRPFADLNDLIESYVYGSAIVVGYFLTHIYGASNPSAYGRALRSARHLGVALQLTNFLRDVAEDQRRGRVYLPVDLLRAQGIERLDTNDVTQHPALKQVVQDIAKAAREHYVASLDDLDAFSPDCRPAIRACIDVYGELNERIRGSEKGIAHRESVPIRRKLQVLPSSKYWRLPLAYLGW
jgi:phytoene synthase